MKRTLITSALPYANGYIHLGHCAGAYLPADIYARWLRLNGENVLYVCGSDEHGVAITIAGEKENISPKEVIDKYHYANLEAFQKFGMTFDIYSRTSEPLHHETAREFFFDFLKKGLLVEREVEQFYDPKAQMFLPDRYVEGICPNCGFEQARGDQCDNCGAYYDQLQLKNPKSLITGEPPVVKKTNHWYLRFDQFQQFLENYIESHSSDWKDNVLQQSRSWLKQGLSERAITRDLNWGVSIENNDIIPAEKSRGKVIYVWFEAVLGYISATKIWAKENAQKNQGSEEDWKIWWQDKDTRYIAFIGKDNIVFHTLLFPAMLYARGDNYILPDNVPANEFLNLEGQKFSKSRNWSIDLRDFIAEFNQPYLIDALRYTLAMNLPETHDSDFTWKDFQTRNNSELSDIFGNYVNRTLQFIAKNFNSCVPELEDKYASIAKDWENIARASKENANIDNLLDEFENKYSTNDRNILQALIKGVDTISQYYSKFRFKDAVFETLNIARSANKYFNDEEPWKTIKTDKTKCAKTLFVCSQLIYSLALLFAPVIPFTAKRVGELINKFIPDGADNSNPEKNNYWHQAKFPQLAELHKFNTPELLFPKIEDSIIQRQIEKLGQKSSDKESSEDNLITLEDFKKLKLTTAKVLDAERVAKSKKLLKLQIDTGFDKRQIVAGIAEHYTPEELIGKTIIVLTNLQPAKLMNEVSQGMLLAANTSDGKLSIITTEKADFPVGAEVR